MKLLHFTSIMLFITISLQSGIAQWTSLGSGIDAMPRSIWSLAVPDSNTVWGFTWDNESTIPTLEFTKSTDGGQTWQTGMLDINPEFYVTHSFALDDTVLWLATSDLQIPATGAIYKTMDGGQTWAHQNTAFPESGEYPMVVHFFNENEGVSFGNGASTIIDEEISIYTTVNGGDTWTKVETLNIPAQLSGEKININICSGLYSAVGNTIWFPTTKGRVFKSEDMGATWEVFDAETSTLTYNPISIAMQDPLNGILTSISLNENQAMKTSDGGETWDSIAIPNFSPIYQIRYIPGTPGTYIAHDGWNAYFSIAYLTKDGGETWEVIETDASLSTSEFLNPTIGYGGGDSFNESFSKIYKWEGNLLVDPVSVKDNNSLAEKIKIFPNPASSDIYFQIPGSINPVQLTIFDCIGNIHFTQKIERGGAPNSLSIKNLPSGVYFLQIKTEENFISKMFVKL